MRTADPAPGLVRQCLTAFMSSNIDIKFCVANLDDLDKADEVYDALYDLLKRNGLETQIAIDTLERDAGYTVEGFSIVPIIISKAYSYMPRFAAEFEQTALTAMPDATVDFTWGYSEAEDSQQPADA
jgi:hypothetical protein